MIKPAKRKRSLIVASIASVLASSVGIQIISLFRSFALPVLLSPAHFGHWNFLLVVIGYGAHTHLGLLHGLGKELPKLLTAQQFDYANKLTNSVFVAIVVLASAGSVFISLISTAFFDVAISDAIKVSLMVIFQSMYIFYLCLLRANNRFHAYGFASLFYAILFTALSVGGAYWVENSLNGALIGMVVAQFIIVVYLYYFANFRINLYFGYLEIRRAFLIGFPQLIIGLVDVIVYTVDRWIVLLNFSATSMGYYAFASLFTIVIAALPLAASQVLFTRFLGNSVIDQGDRDSGYYFIATSTLCAFAVGCVALIVHFLLQKVIPIYFTAYVEAVPLAKILVFGAFYFSFAQIAGMYLISVDQHYKMLLIQAYSLVIGVAVSLYCITNNLGLVSVAYGTASLYIAYGSSYLFFATLKVKCSYWDAILFMLKVKLPFAMIFIFNYAMSGFVITGDLSLAWELLTLLIAPLLIYYLVFLLLFPKLFRHYRFRL